MIAPCKFGIALPLAIALSLLALAHSADSQEHTIDTVRNAWSNRRNATQAIDYIATGQGCFVKGSLTADAKGVSKVPIEGDFPAADHIFPVRFRFAVRFLDKKLRKERDTDMMTAKSDAQPEFHTNRLRYVFDGKSGVTLVPPEHRDSASLESNVWVANERGIDLIIDPIDYPFLLALGIVPFADRNIRPDDLPTPPAQLPYSVVSDPSGKSSPDTLVLRTSALSPSGDRYDEVWVDPSRDCVITKYVIYAGAQVRQSIELTYEEKDGLWLLSGWNHAFVRNGEIRRWYKLTVKHLDINPILADELFAFAEQPGDVVSDERTSAAYIVGSGGEKTPLSVAMARRESQSTGLGRHAWWLVPAIAFGALAVLLLCVWFRQRSTN